MGLPWIAPSGKELQMQLDEKLFRQIAEVSYLAVKLLRFITLRYFYQMKTRHYLFPDEITII